MNELKERVFKRYTNGPFQTPSKGSLAGLTEIWEGLCCFWHETEEEEEALDFGIVGDFVLGGLERRGVPVRKQEDQHPKDPPTLVALEERIPHLKLVLIGDMMRVCGDVYAFHYHMEAYNFRKVADTEEVQRVIPWDADVMGCATAANLGPMIVKTIDELMEGFAEGFKRDNPQFAIREA